MFLWLKFHLNQGKEKYHFKTGVWLSNNDNIYKPTENWMKPAWATVIACLKTVRSKPVSGPNHFLGQIHGKFRGSKKGERIIKGIRFNIYKMVGNNKQTVKGQKMSQKVLPPTD